jgi:DNA anti-recombination protein RmuC
MTVVERIQQNRNIIDEHTTRMEEIFKSMGQKVMSLESKVITLINNDAANKQLIDTMTPMHHTNENIKEIHSMVAYKCRDLEERIEQECKNIFKNIEKRDNKISELVNNIYLLEKDHGNTKNIIIKAVKDDINKLHDKLNNENNYIKKSLEHNVGALKEDVAVLNRKLTDYIKESITNASKTLNEIINTNLQKQTDDKLTLQADLNKTNEFVSQKNNQLKDKIDKESNEIRNHLIKDAIDKINKNYEIQNNDNK